MINKAILMGRMVATPELRSTQSGVPVTQFTLAVDREYVKSGEERKCDFIVCVAWRNTAEFITKYFQKGSMIAVVGEIQSRNYEDKNGNKRTAIEVIVTDASFCGSKNDSSAKPSESDYDDEAQFMNDDDLPF